MMSNSNNVYQNNQYKEWLTLPPQIPIPYNQSYLYTLSLQIYNLDYIDTLLPINKPSIQPNDNKNSLNSNPNQFRFKTYWWGQQSGYQSLLKTLLINKKSTPQSQKKPHFSQIHIQSNGKQTNQLIFQPIKFLVCCPLDNFLKYCFDMRVLKIQLLSVQLNSIIAKSYINFLTLNNCWKGEPVQLNIPLFAPSFNLQSFNGVQSGKNPKIIGQIRLQMVLQKIPNPYKIVPERPNEIQPTNIKSQDERRKKSWEKLLKQNNNNNQANKNIMSNSKNDKDIEQGCDFSYDQGNSESEQLVEDYSGKNTNFGKSDHLISYHNFDQNMNNRRNRNHPKIQSKQKQGNQNLQFQNPQHKRIKIPKRNYESQKIKLHQDFKLIFGIKNPLYSSFFKSNSSNNPAQVQTIQFHVKVLQSQQINDKNFSYDHVNVLIPVISNQDLKSVEAHKFNQYRICQQQGIIKIQFEIGSFSAQQIENFIKQAIISVEVFYSKKTKKQMNPNKKPLNGHLPGIKQSQQVFTQRGTIGLLSLLANCGVYNRVNLLGNSKIGKMFECFILAQSGHSQLGQTQQGDKKNEGQLNQLSKKGLQERKNTIGHLKGMREQLIWLKIDKFIPLNQHYFKQSNIYIKINLIQADKTSTQQHTNQKLHLPQKQGQKVKISLIGQTPTLWKPFGQITQLIAYFKNQSITFPIYTKAYEEKQLFLSLQVWNRQKKNIRIGNGLVSLKGGGQRQLRGRLQLEVKDVKQQRIGFIEIWCQRGDINYINSLMTAHLNQKQVAGDEKFKKKKNQEHEGFKKKKLVEEQAQSSQSGFKESCSQNLQNSSSMQSSSARIQQDSHQKGLKSNQNQVIKRLGLDDFIQLEKRLNKCHQVLQIHNQLSFALLMVVSSLPTHPTLSHFIDKFQTQFIPSKSLSQSHLFMEANQFYTLIANVFCSSSEKTKFSNSQLKQLRNFIETHQPLSQPWFSSICDIYSNVNINQDSQTFLINFTQFQNSIEAFSTYYVQIIQSKNHAFNQFKGILNSAFIQINQIQDEIIYQLEAANPKQRQSPEFIKRAKSAICLKILKSSRFNQSTQIQLETHIQNFLSFYSQRSLRLSNQFEAVGLAHLICDQLRKFQLYDTTFETIIQPECFKSFISKNLREILDIDHYLKPDQLINLVQQNQIQLSQWQIFNLSDTYRKEKNLQYMKGEKNQKILSKDPSNEKIIIKSPTFGLLEHVNSNHNDLRNDKLFKTSPLDYNPSIVHKMKKQPENCHILEISEVGSNEEKKESDNSYILKKRIEMISPISNNIDINHEISSAIDPSSMFFNNYKNKYNLNSMNNSNSNNPNNDHDKYSTNQDQALEISQNQLSTDCLTVLFGNLKRKIIWLKSGKFTYFPQQSHIDQMSKIQIEKSLNQIQKSIQQDSHYLSIQNNKDFNNEKSKQIERESQHEKSANLKIQSKNRENQSLSPTLINLFGLQAQNYYNLQIRISDESQDLQEEILVNCQHSLWEKLIDCRGKQIGSLIVCLNSQLQCNSLNISNN